VDVEQEQEIIGNLGTAHINTWRKLRLVNPYRFHERQYTGSDKRFWTDSQCAMWDDYYDASEHMKSGFYVVPKSLNVEHFQHFASKDFRYINEALLKMDILDLVTLSEPIQPLAVCQFCCTVFFHNDPAESFSWMTARMCSLPRLLTSVMLWAMVMVGLKVSRFTLRRPFPWRRSLAFAIQMSHLSLRLPFQGCTTTTTLLPSSFVRI
jgi:hypothetical protein